MSCGFCHQDLSGATCTLTCSHVVHTYCLMHKMMMDTPIYYNCGVCGQVLHEGNQQTSVDNDTLSDHGTPINNPQTAANLYNTNMEFRNDIKDFYKQLKLLSKSNRQFSKYITQERRSFKEAIEPLKQSIKELQKQKLRDIYSSEQRRESLKQYRKGLAIKKKILEKYKEQNLDSHHFRHLGNLEGIKNFGSLYNTFRFRYRYHRYKFGLYVRIF